MATELEWAEAYRAQAAADLRAAEQIQGTEPSILAMLLQMAYEKLGKSALLRGGIVGVRRTQATHQAARAMMQVVGRSRRKCEALGFKQAYVQSVVTPMVTQLEDLNPAVVRARGAMGPWLEYPWEDPKGRVRWPANDLPG